jgi:microsomal dipeptidase-like Zn-dependent dipeptidase
MVSTLVVSGWADLHTHPMIHLAFAGKLVHGGPDVGSLLPQDLTCNGPTRATSITHALGSDRPSHGGHDFVNFRCGDELRKMLIHEFQKGNEALETGAFALGAPDFGQWPAWNDITHQKMWFEWVRRARDGGLRVMVALATNNKTLGDAVAGNGDGPTDDKASADLQLTETKAWVNRHPDFMELAFNAADIKRIAQANKIAVVLGVEIDNIGNFNLPALAPLLSNPVVAKDIIAGEIQRLYAAGVRYVIPVHVSDNVFGGAAIYKNDFNTANLRETGHFWSIECANVEDNITHTYTDGYDPLRAVAAFAKLGLDPFRRSGPGPDCPAGQQGKSRGHRNAQGLTHLGVIALKEMMKRGMIVDIDHMSQKTADATLDLAETFGYPIVSGHSGIRGQAGADAENSRTKRHLERISKLHGMFGLGTDGAHRNGWASQYQTAMTYMGYQSADTGKAIYRNGAVAFGTDLNGLVKGPKPGGSNSVTYDASFPKSSSANVGGSKYWDYNTEGVAHYGMMADFVRHVRTAPSNNYTGLGGIPLGVPGSELVDHHLNRNANYFWLMWQRIEARKGSVQ